MCDNLCTVLGKNAPNGYTEIHQSILNSYNIIYIPTLFGAAESSTFPAILHAESCYQSQAVTLGPAHPAVDHQLFLPAGLRQL